MKGGNSTEGGVGEFQSRAALRAVDLGGALSRYAFEVPNRARSSTHHILMSSILIMNRIDLNLTCVTWVAGFCLSVG